MSDEQEERAAKRFEFASGLTLAILAAVTAVNDLGAGKYGDDEIMGHNERAAAFEWYQSKSIKQTVIEQQKDMLQALLDAGAIAPAATATITERTSKLDVEISRYKKEKKEIMEGSKAVGPEGQVLEKNGEKGQIIGANEWDHTLDILGPSGDLYDLATLWLQLSLVVGAMSLVLQQVRMKWAFYAGMVAMGGVGLYYSVQAWQMAMSAGG